MDELVRLVTQKTGISEDQARTAVTTVIGFLKERMPAPIAGELDKYLSGGASGSGGLGGMAGQAESMLGGLGKK